MRKIFVIAKREYQAAVRTKAFLISLFLMPVLMGGGIAIQSFLEDRVDVDEKRVVVIDETGKLMRKLKLASEDHNTNWIFDPKTHRQNAPRYVLEPFPKKHLTDEDRLALSERARKREIAGFIEIPPDVLESPTGVLSAIGKSLSAAVKEKERGGPGPDEVFFYAESATQFELTRWFRDTLNRLIHSERLRRSGIDPKLVDYAITPVSVEPLSLYERSASGQIKKAEKSNRELAIFLPMGIMMMMFMAIMLSSTPLLQSILEEKQQRIAEVLLGSANPFQIMMGKLLGTVGVSITMIAIYMGGGYYVLNRYGVAHLLPGDIAAWFLVYQVLAVMLFGSVFIAIGAACTEIKETQNYMTPTMLVLVLPMMVWFLVLREPMSPFSTWLSFFPPSTPMLMVLRMAATKTLPVWQPLLGIVLVLVTTLFFVFAAGRVFRIGILSQGKAPKITELMRWIISG